MSIFDQQIAAAVAEWKERRKTIGRNVTEWKGKTADSMPPPSVRQRIFETWGGVCWLSGIIIDPAKGFDLEHVVEIADGKIEANREGCLRPVLRDPHIAKTARLKKQRALADRKAQAAAGIKAAPKHPIKTAPAPVRPPQQKASKPSERVEQIRALGPVGIARRFAGV